MCEESGEITVHFISESPRLARNHGKSWSDYKLEKIRLKILPYMGIWREGNNGMTKNQVGSLIKRM